MTISGSVLTLLLMVLRYTVLRKMPSTVYYYAWLLVLLRFALPLPGLVPTTAEKAEPALELTQTEPTAKTNQEDAEPARKKRPYHRRKNTETAGEAPAAEGTSEPKKKRPYTRRKKSTAEEQPQA